MSKYLSIPTALIKSNKLTHTELFLFVEICNLSELKKGCIAQNEHFAELFGMSVKSVSNILSNLVKKGFIKTEIQKGSRNQIRRIFTIHNLGNYYPQNMDSLSTKYGESKENITIEYNNKKNKQKKDHVLPAFVDAELFDEYLDLRKKNKLSNSKTVLTRLINKLSDFNEKGHDVNEIILNAITGGWRDFYEPKQNNNFQNNKQQDSISNLNSYFDELKKQDQEARIN